MLKDKSIVDFLAATASSEPVPGGGSIAALSGSLAAALGEMVGRLTTGKEKYLEVEKEMLGLMEDFRAHQTAFVDFIDEDAASFDGVMQAFKMPKATEEEKKARSEAIQLGMKTAATVPMAVATRCLEMMSPIEAIVTRGNANAVTDGAVAAMMCRTAGLSALLNVRINLSAIKDDDFVRTMTLDCNALESRLIQQEQEILKKVRL
jgi:formiminotetrahydrofolate cyclodeaminase